MDNNIIDYSPEYWEKRFKEKSSQTDHANPTPILKELLETDYFSEPGRIAIIGCAICQDVIQYTKNNHLVTVIAPSKLVLEQTRKKVKKLKSIVETLYSDLFEIPGKLLHKFDYLIEYSFCTEIVPERQIEYFDNIQKLIKPGGFLIVFLQVKNDSTSYPPFPVNIENLEEHLRQNFQLIESRSILSEKEQKDVKEILKIFRKFLQ